MAKQLNVSLAFTADTGKAKAQLQDLQNSLDKLINSTSTNTSNFGLTKELAQATTEASKLKIMLESATNSTGSLDLGKFNQSLKQSGMELKDYAEVLSSLGPEGSKAFAKLAQSITTANVPLRQTNKLLDEFATTMKNTVRWQFSSSMLHGFMGAVSGALGYAKDLDKSLNDIRIVTGYNTDQMAKFAEEANRAAKALSSTTTDYTNASLIYYQQGLGEDEIAKRTEVTMKMANAAGVSAQKVSDQMTAVWNNFDDGSKSLEYYADVMTALGAATASSTDEISAGLNKFASVAETVGLSYEYATAALATVTSTTRESADVVGTAFKTLFARIQGLNLGETLEDGTTLNKYSAALAKVGIDIKDTNGEMKDMNTILDEMGAKWNTLAKDQQTALAQTVAGVRQYTQLVALMNNWDFFKENVKTAETATGALQKQADIYAESWEASSKRVKAAAQGIYDKLIDEDFFIGVNKVLEGTLTQVGNLIDGLGGLPGILSIVSSLMLKAFGKDIVASMERMAYNIKLTSKEGQQAILEMRKDANKQTREMYSNSSDSAINNPAKVDIITKQTEIQDKLIDKVFQLEVANKSLTEEEQKQAQLLLDQNQALGDQYEKIVKIKNESEIKENKSIRNISTMTKDLDVRDKNNNEVDVKSKLSELKKLQTEYSTGITLLEKYKIASKDALSAKNGSPEKRIEMLQKIKDHLTSVKENAEKTGNEFTRLNSIIQSIDGIDDLETALNALEENLEQLGSDSYKGFEQFRQELQNAGADMSKLDPELNAIWDSFTRTGELTEEQIQTFANFGVQIDKTGKIIEGFHGKVYTTADSLVAFADVITNVSMGINALKGLGDIWSNEDLTYGEKILSTITTLASIIPIMVSSYQAWNAVKLSGIKNDIAQAAINLKLINQEGIKTGQQVIQNGLLTKEIALEVIKQNLNIKKLAITLAIVAAVSALIAVGKVLYDNYNKEAIAAKRLADSYKELNKASQEARAEADELNSAISGYDNAVEKLEACTRGTEEWRDALKEVNKAAIEVIENLPENLPDGLTLSDIYDKKTGTFNQENLAKVQEKVEEQANSAAYAASAGEIRAQQAQVTADAVNLFRDMVRTQNAISASSSVDGNVSPVNFVNARDLVNNLDELANLPMDDFKAKLEDLGVSTQYLSNTALEEYRTQINKLAESSEFAADKLDLITRVKVDEILGDEYDNEEKEIAARSMSEDEDRLYKEYLDKYTGWGINKASGSNNDIYQTILKDLRDAGYDYDAQKSNAVRGNDKNRSFAFLDENGEEVIRTAEWVAETVAASKALQDLEASAEEASTWLGNLDKNASDSTASGVRSVISGGDLSGLTQNEVTQLSNDMGGADGNLTSDEIINYLKTTMGITDDADLAKVFGVDNVGEVAANWLDIISSTNEQFAKIVADLPVAVRGIFEGMDLEKFSLNEQGIIGNLLVDAFENGGTKGAKELESILNSMFTASGEDADDLAKALGGIDWQTTDINELIQILEDAGIETSGFTDELAKLIDLMREGQNVGFEAASEHYSTMKDMSDLKEGDTITEEQYKYLVNAGIDASEYFKLMGDGSYALKEDAEEFYRIVNEKSLDVFKSNIKAMYEEIGSVDGIMRRQNEDSIATNNINTGGGYNQSLVSDQLTFLEALGVELESLEVYQKMVEEGRGMSVEALQEIQRLVEENKNRWDELPESIQASAVELEKHQQALANSASTVDELNRLYEEQFITLEQYQEAVNEVMENEFEMEGLDPDAAEEVADAFRDMAEAGVEGMEALKNDEEAVKDATVRYMELNEAIEDIYDNYKDYTQVLKDVRNATSKADRAMAANSETAKKLRVSMAGLLGTTEDMIDADFLATINPKDFEAAANGNVDAIERIRHQFIQLKAEMYDIDFASLKSELDAFNNGAYIDLNTTPFLNALIQAAVNAGQTAAEIEAMLSGFGIDADVTPFTEELWQATQQAQAAGQDIANATSFTTEVEQEQVENPRKVENPKFDEIVTVTHKYGWNQVTLNGGFGAISYPSIYAEAHKGVNTSVDTQEFNDTETVKGQTVKNGAGASGKGGVIVKNAHKAPTPSRTPSAGNTSRPPVSSGGGGGGSSKEKEPSKPKKINYTKESDIVERYKEVNDALDNVADSMTRVQMEADILWGKNHINNLKEQNELLEKQIELLDRQYEEAKQYQEKDKVDLGKAASALNVSLVLDSETGDITNIEDAEESIYRQLAAAEEHYNSLATGEEQDAYEETILEPLRQKIKDFETARDLYYDSVETAEDALIAKQEMELQKMANNFEIWSEGLEIEIKFNEDDLELIEAMLSRIEDDIYQMAEAAVLMTGIGGSENGQLGEYLNNLDIYDQKLNELNQKYESGEITEAAYYEGLEEVKTGILDNVASIQELDKTMMTYYGDTLVAAGEELARYTDLIEEQNSVLEYYLELLDLMGESADYKKIGVVLEGQAEIAEEQAKTSREWYEARRVDAENAKAAYEEALAMGVSEEEVALLKEKWLAAEEAAAEAQDKMLSDAEAWAEALRAILENKLSELGQTLENALTQGFGSFDAMTTALERANSLQEEYLTTTNQIYETNKLMRTAQQEIDKTSNTVAKRRLKSFIEETQHLQDQTKLSQYELEIQQAKYDLLLAEMALEDAQNAKSTVRLQRDAEGNFGYVYTADQNALSQAEQKLEDAQNRLYNIGLEGANEYAEKYQQTLNEMYDTLNDIQQQYLEGSFETEEEYHKAMADAKAYYYEKLQQYSSLYQVAITTDSRVVRDAWTSDFSSMIYETDKWMDEVTTYVSAVQEAFTAWKNEISGPGGVEELVGNSLGEISKNVDEVTDKSGNLSDTINDEVIPALNEEINAVDELTNQYATMRESIQLVTERHLEQVRSINKATEAYYALERAQNAANNASQSVTLPNYPDNSTSSSNSSSSNSSSSSSHSSNSNSGNNDSYQTTTPNVVKEDKWKATYRLQGKTTTLNNYRSADAARTAAENSINANVNKLTGVTLTEKTDMAASARRSIAVAKYDTGGYTGSWGPYGKLAMLHEKELVLNKEDTENFLASMEILDEILKMIDLQSLNSQIGGLLNSPRLQEIQSQMLEQSVKIEAIFPGISDRNELEEAFNNLINQASQYANRK